MVPSEPPLRVWRTKIVRGMSTRGAALVSGLIGELRGARKKSKNKCSTIGSQDTNTTATQPCFSLSAQSTGQQLVASMDRTSEICGIANKDSTSKNMVEDICVGLADLHLSIPLCSGGISRSRLEWLLSKLPLLDIPRDPVITHPVLDKFELFQELPVEIRLKIWGMLSCLPRKVKLLELPLDPEQSYWPVWNSVIDSQSKHPVVVHICKESREEALRYYTICHDKFRFSYRSMGLRANTYFINFAVDTFVHPSSQFKYRDRMFPGPARYNFEYGFLRQIQRIEHLPCYQGSIFSFSRIYFDTAFTIHHFRQSHWIGLRHVTMFVDDICFGHEQETLGFNLYSIQFKSAVRKLMESDRFLLYQPDGSSKGFEKTKFDIEIQWKSIRGDEELDLVPCKPYDSLCTPWLSDAKHYPCRKHLKELNGLHGSQNV